MTAAVIAGLIAVLAAVGLLTGATDSDQEPRASGPSIVSIARRVERIRQLQFDDLPAVRHVTGAQARAYALRELDREATPAEVAAEERLLKLLDLIPPDATLRDLIGKTLSSEVGGFYDPHTGTLSIVDGNDSGLFGEITLAHELTHALEDQALGLELEAGSGFQRDRATARSALQEGTATIAMVDYLVRRQTGSTNPAPAFRRVALKGLRNAGVPVSSGLPRYVREGLVFPYAAGARLVDRVEVPSGWTGVDDMFDDPPVSTEQVIHPAKYRAREAPVRVRVDPPPGTRLVQRGDFGEFDTGQLLLAANGRRRAAAAAAGWGGGGYALWRRGGRDGVVLRWTWDSARDEREFVVALRATALRLGDATVNSGNDGVELRLAPRG